ncbi:MAG: family 43 glycosylhydrolase [Clostridia bacterium]|nr:family 43 glycosylhydrolase [Clostridia bacterium]
MKNLFYIRLFAVLALMLCTALFAAETEKREYTYVYVNSETGRDAAGNGSAPDRPLKTWTWGVKYGQTHSVDTLVVVFTNEYHFNTSPSEAAHDYPIIFTTRDGVTDYAKENGAKLVFGSALRYYINGDTAFEQITIEYEKSLNVIAQYHPVRMGKGVKTVNRTSEISQLLVLGGYQAPKADADVTKDSHVVIEDGDYYIVAGGTRDTYDKTPLWFTGTHYITVNGGRIANLYGGSVRYQYSTGADITVNGGYIENFHVGGDLSRRLNGDACATFNGGEIKTLNVNNIIGTGKITLNGTKIGSMSVWYANDEVSTLNQRTNLPLYLYYNANEYTAQEIAAFQDGFDYTENIARVYAAANAAGSGTTAEDPANFADAFARAAGSGSTLMLLGDITLIDFDEPAHTETVNVKGISPSVTLTVSGRYALSGKTAFAGVTLGGSGVFDAENGVFETAADVKTTEKPSVTGSAFLRGGAFASVTNAKNVILDGASADRVVGGDAAVIELNGGSVKTVKSSEGGSQSFEITVNGALVETVVFNNISKSLSLKYLGGRVGAFTCIGANARGRATLGDGIGADALGDAKDLFDFSTDKVCFVRDGGDGNGGSFASACGSFEAAYKALGEAGGTIVVCGKVTLASAFAGYNYPHTGKVTVTSLYDGIDHRTENGAKIIMRESYHTGGETEFNNIYIISEAKYKAIAGEYHKLVLGNGIECDRVDGQTYPVLLGGGIGDARGKSTDLTVKSGTWGRVRGGASGNAFDCSVEIRIEGGAFRDNFILGSTYSHTGNINATFSGGTMYATVTGSNLTKADQVFAGNIDLRIEGGQFYNKLLYAAGATGSYSGTYNVNISGGDFAHLVEFTGAERVGVPSFVTSTVDLSEIETGTYSFTNYVRMDGADPWLFYHDGFYYYTSTTGNPGISLTKTANIGDLIYTAGKTIFTPKAGEAYSESCWSPEIHHYTDEEVGAGNGGWYLYFAGSGGQTESDTGHRMFVLKCLDGDDLLGRWGNPITGEVNLPEKVSVELEGFNDRWSGGQTDIRIGGKLYNLFVSVEGEPGKRNQNINIVEMTNPWTIRGKSTVLVRPEYDWEIGRHTTLTIVECGTAVYGEDGSIYIVYSACGYNTPEYKLGQLKYKGGDPLDTNSWEKYPEPILSMNGEICGIGSASYVDDTSGQGWICYNAYLGRDTNGGRYAFVEPYHADEDGVVISEGTGHPSSPDRVYTQAVNPNPVINKMRGFAKIDYKKDPFAAKRQYSGNFTDVEERHWFRSYVESAYERELVNGTSKTKFSPDGAFTVAQALTAAANIHTAYFGMRVRATASGEDWYVPYVEYCVQNGIIPDGQFADVDADITRGDMAVIFANILPDSAYAARKDGVPPDIAGDMPCSDAVAKLYRAGIVGGDADTGKYRPGDPIRRSEACVIFTRIALQDTRIK